MCVYHFFCAVLKGLGPSVTLSVTQIMCIAPSVIISVLKSREVLCKVKIKVDLFRDKYST